MGGVVYSPFGPCPDDDDDMDFFVYNFMGQKGKFVYDSGSQTIKQINQTDLRIQPFNNDNGFDIITTDGTKYEFRQKEYTREFLQTLILEEMTSYYEMMKYFYPSSWYLTRIESPTAREVIFTYSTDTSLVSINRYDIEQENLQNGLSWGWDPLITLTSEEQSGILQDYFGLGTRDPFTEDMFEQNVQVQHYNVYLEKIDFGIGEIMFTTESRDDTETPVNKNPAQKLKEIIISEKLNNKIQRKITLVTGYFDSGMSGSSFLRQRLRLDEIVEKNSLDEIIDRYTFEYEESVNLPNKDSQNRDYWGYYNGDVGNENVPVHLKTFTSDGDFSKANLLTKIYYPTGGTTTFFYEENTFSNRGDINKGGGNRIERIENFDGVITSTKRYEYLTDDETPVTSGKLIAGINSSFAFEVNGEFEVQLNRIIDSVPTQVPCDISFSANYMCYTQFNCLGINDGDESNFVGYSRVTEYNDIEGVQGKTVYSYENYDLPEPSSNSYCPNKPRQTPPLNGKLKNRTIYEAVKEGQNILYKPVEDYTYKYSTANTLFTGGKYLGTNERNYSAVYQCALIWTGYNIQSDWVRCDEEIIKNYDKNIPQGYVGSTFKNYYLSPHHKQITKVDRFLNEDENYSSSIYEYPPDVETTGKQPDQIAALNGLMLQNRLMIIKQYDYRNGSFSKMTEVNYFVDNDAVVLPQNVIQQNGTGAPYTIIEYLQYDEFKNATQIKREDGIITSYKWEHMGNYPAFEAKNAGFNEVYYTSYEDSPVIQTTAPYLFDPSFSHTGTTSLRSSSSVSGEVYYFTPFMDINNNTTKKYKYSCWVFSNNPSVQLWAFMKPNTDNEFYSSGWQATDVITNETNKWILLSGEITVPDNMKRLYLRLDNNGGGTVWFDDLKLYPSDSEVTTFSNKPLLGISSKTDPNNLITHYGYDPSGRLSFIKDYQGNIIKSFQYNYIHK